MNGIPVELKRSCNNHNSTLPNITKVWFDKIHFNKYISAITDPILAKLWIITAPTTETTKKNYKKDNNIQQQKQQQQQQISANNDLIWTNLKLDFHNNNNKTNNNKISNKNNHNNHNHNHNNNNNRNNNFIDAIEIDCQNPA